MALTDAIRSAMETSRKLRASSARNEANTKAVLIEPLLAQLGWDPADLEVVEREVMVYEGTFLDYALKLDGVARIYVEAKAVAARLDDRRFVAQTVNYANNDGVVWCVLTNGVQFRVYKTNEPLVIDRKLLFEVDLADEREPLAEKARMLALIGRAAVADGSLDAFGETFFTDARVRGALARLAAKPSRAFLDAITGELGRPHVPEEALRRSLARILADDVAPGPAVPASDSAAKAAVGPPSPPRGREYELGHHFGNKSVLIRELWEQLDAFAGSLGGDVTRRVRKQYIGYFRGNRSFFTTEIQQRRVIAYLSLTPETATPWDPERMQDVANVGHFGMGDVMYSLTAAEQLDALRALVRRAYEARRTAVV
jgi:predicted transport protein